MAGESIRPISFEYPAILDGSALQAFLVADAFSHVEGWDFAIRLPDGASVSEQLRESEKPILTTFLRKTSALKIPSRVRAIRAGRRRPY